MPVTSRYSSPVNYQSILGTDSYKYFSNSSRYFNSIPTSSTSATTKRGSGNNDTSSSAYSNRFVSSLSNCNRSSTSSAIRSSIDRDTLTKPPIGSSTLARLRSESRLRDHSLDSSSYPSSTTKSSQGKSNDQLYSHLSAPYKRHSLKNIPSESSYTSNSSSSSSTPSSRLTLPSPSSSLEHYVAISGLDIQKYSPANYIPRHELLRSRSLSEATSSKLNAIDKSSSSVSSSGSSSTLGTTSTSTTTPSSATSKYNRSTSNDRDATNKVKKFNNVKNIPSSTHLTNRNTNNNINNNKTYSNYSSNNSNKRYYCHLINNSSDSIVDFQNNNNNNNNNDCNDLTNNNVKNSIDITSVKFSQKFPKYPAACNVASVANVNNNDNNNINNSNNSNFYENKTINSNNNNIKRLQTTNCNRNDYNNSNESVTINNMLNNDNVDKINNNIINNENKNNNQSSNEELKRDMEFITKQLGVPPLTTSHLKNGSQFLKSEYENARNQVICNKKVSDININDNNNINKNDNISILNRKIINTSYNTNISNINNNQNSAMIEKSIYEFDDIKFIDSDESGERKASPTTKTMILSTKDLINNLNNYTSSSLRHQQKKATVSPLRTPSHLLSFVATSTTLPSTFSSSTSSSSSSSSFTSSSKLPNVSTSATSSSSSSLSSPKIQTTTTLPITIKRVTDVQKTNKYNTLSSAHKTPYLNEIIAATGHGTSPIDVGGGGGSTGIHGGRTSPAIKQILTSTTGRDDIPNNSSNITPIIITTTTTTTITTTMTTTTIHHNTTGASLPVEAQQIANKLRKNDLLNEFIANNNNNNINSNNNNNIHKNNNINIKNENIRNSSSLARLPPSSSSSLSSSATNRFRDRDGGAAGGGTAIGGARTSSRTLSDSDAFNRSSLISSSSDKLSNSDNSEGLCGLRNIGNTCYMNSVLQCLSHTNELTQYLKNKSEGRSQTKDERILNEFISLIKDMWSPNTRTVTPSELKSAFSSKHRMYYGSIQQDAQEFLRFFLDSLHCGLNKGVKGDKLVIDDSLSDNSKADLTWEWYSKFENSKIKDLFVGQLKSSLKCTVCGNTSVTFDPFWDLSVPLTPLSTSSKCKLESCMDLFIKEEILDGDEMPTCSKCNTRRKSTKSLTIQRFPKYLVIPFITHLDLKRFSETRWSKIANIVEFPTGDRGLNMAPYAANSSSVIYSLYGISNHMGSTAEGHYVALCKHPVTKKWHEFNDNSVSDRSESSLVSSSAYLLFYERS